MRRLPYKRFRGLILRMAGRPDLSEFQPESWKTKAGRIGSSFKSSKKDVAATSKTPAASKMSTASQKPAAAKKPPAAKKPADPKGGSDIKSRDWTREKEGAAKAGTAVKNGVVTGAVATKDGSVKAYGWLASKIKGGGGPSKGANSQLSGH